MRTLLILIISCASAYSLHTQTFLALKDSAYFGPTGGETYNALVQYDPLTCMDSLITIIDTQGYQVIYATDIAAEPAGQIYLLAGTVTHNSTVGLCVFTLNIQDGSISCLFDLASFGVFFSNSLVCSADSVLYMAGDGLVSYDLKTGIGAYHGAFPNFFSSSGDMIFYEDRLYLTGGLNELMEVNINNPAASTIVATYSDIPINRQVWGIASTVYDCDSSALFLITAELIDNFEQRAYDIYTLDFPTQQTTLLCTGTGHHYYTGSTTYNEYLASDCSVRLDLDKNDSSGADSADYQITLCNAQAALISDTLDTELYSGYRIDSLRLQLQSPLPDEGLTAGFVPPALSVSGQNSASLVFYNPGNVLSNDFKAALRSVSWQYTGMGDPAPGLRTIEVILFARNNHRDTATAYLNVIGLPQAGRDTSVTICIDGDPFQLSDLLAPDASPGGTWLPVLSGNTFDPATMASGDFHYMISGGPECPPDTALITVSVTPLPIFSLGADALLCHGDTLSLTASTGSTWYDGMMEPTRQFSQPGVYWAEAIDINGCRYRDSILITGLQPQSTQSSEQTCYGQSYFWNNSTFTADTTACLTFTGLNGCDSTHCLTLDFFYPTLSLDTILCSGGNISWQGQTYTTAGIYTDTILLGGCLTATRLELTFAPNDTTPITARVCPNEPYVLGNQTFGVPGNYLVSLPSETGCDSLVALNLSWWPVPQAYIAGDTAFCSGGSTMLEVPGFVFWQWSVPDATGNTLQVTQGGPYTVTVTDQNGCTSSASVHVSEMPVMEAEWEVEEPVCADATDGSIVLVQLQHGNPPLEYSLNGQIPIDVPVFENLNAGTYSVVITDASGCSVDTAFTLTAPPPPGVELGPDQSVQSGTQITLPAAVTGGVPPFVYQWSPPAGLSCSDCPEPLVSPFDTTQYLLIVTDANGCSGSDSILILILSSGTDFIYVPNVFSPDGDQQNDFFGIFVDVAKVRSVDLLRVYDRWGSLLYESRSSDMNNTQAGWGGTFRGKLLPPGVYVWHVSLRLADGTTLLKSGEVLLQR